MITYTAYLIYVTVEIKSFQEKRLKLIEKNDKDDQNFVALHLYFVGGL